MENKTNKQKNSSNTVKKKPNYKIIVFLLFFVVLLIANFVLLFWVSKNEKAAQGADSVIKLSAQGGFNCDYAEAQKLFPFNEGVFKVTSDRVAYLTMSGNEIYSYKVNLQNPFCKVENGYAAVLDTNGYSFSLYSDKGQILNISTEDKVKAISISPEGLCAVVVDKEDAYGQVILYDNSGKVFGQWISYNSGYPLALAFDRNSGYLAISVLNTSGASVQSSVKMIKINKLDNKYEAVDYAVYSIDSDKLILSVLFADNGNLYAFSSDYYYVINTEGNITTYSFDSGVINYCFSLNGNIFLVYSDGVDQINKLMILSPDAKQLYDSVIGTDVFAINTSDDRYVIGVDRRIFVYDCDGNILSDTEIDEDVIRLGLIAKNRVVVVSTNGVHILNY